ncbi:MAG TPA: class I SAM-dependent methyltransferase [Gammaproteobacteria bacterium]|nr:class I SAM-dependent methyltransferase [Gammaproteobacteria bacterium]
MSNNVLTEDEFKTLIQLAKKVVWTDRETKRKIQANKINITPVNFYSNIPSVEDMENSFEYKKPHVSDGPYSDIFDPKKMAWVLSELKQYSEEFNPPVDKVSEDSTEFYWNNSSFSYMDAMSYYCMIRYFKPDRIVEIGSGMSTVIANQAMGKNAKGEQILIEPYPLDYLTQLPTVSSIEDRFVQSFDLQELVALVDSSDMLFIDSTHTVKLGSDCLYIYLKLLPAISKKLIVHAHDIALPYAFGPSKFDKHVYWTEQYLLYAYMLDNPKVKTLMGSLYAKKNLPVLSKLIMNDKYGDGGGSFWFELDGSA